MNTSTKAIKMVEKSEAVEKARLVYSKEDMTLLRASFFKGANDNEIKIGLMLAAQYGLDPFLREIWFIPNMGLLVSRDGLLKAAKQRKDFDGLTSGVFYRESEIDIDYEAGIIKSKITAEMLMSKEAPIAGWAICKRKGFSPVVEIVRFNEYDKGSPTWKKYPSAMIKKTAESIALRKQFGISGIVPADEVEEKEMVNITPTPEIKDERVKAMQDKVAKRKPVESTKAAKTVEPEVIEFCENDQIEELRKQVSKESDLKSDIVLLKREIAKIDAQAFNDIVMDKTNGELKPISQLSEEEMKAIIETGESFIESHK